MKKEREKKTDFPVIAFAPTRKTNLHQIMLVGSWFDSVFGKENKTKKKTRKKTNN